VTGDVNRSDNACYGCERATLPKTEGLAPRGKVKTARLLKRRQRVEQLLPADQKAGLKFVDALVQSRGWTTARAAAAPPESESLRSIRLASRNHCAGVQLSSREGPEARSKLGPRYSDQRHSLASSQHSPHSEPKTS
jgi:hypothetical protein